MLDLAAIQHRWTRITDQDIGEAQHTIQELLDALEAARAVVGAAERHTDLSRPPGDRGKEFFTLSKALTAFRAQVGG
mgnify:CR=1 FL=1